MSILKWSIPIEVPEDATRKVRAVLARFDDVIVKGKILELEGPKPFKAWGDRTP